MLGLRDGTEVTASRGTGGVPYWDVEIRYPSESRPRKEWVATMAKLAPRVAAMPGFVRTAIYRHGSGLTDFVPDPPIAAQNHLVSTTDAEVADSYDDPSQFWGNWETIDDVGGYRICTRALGELDEHSWLGFTYEGTMAMARAAKPNKTRYKPARWMPEFAAWWEPGDYEDEKGGNPALRVAGYQASTKTLEMTGFIVDKPLTDGGSEPRHVLIKEIYTVRGLVKRKKDAEGRPIETLRVVFPEAWMARQERRPLLDAGAKVFYMDRKSGELVEVTD